MTSDKMAKLARMANQISDFYASMPGNEGAAGTASHLKLYWTPKMIRELIASVDAGAVGLKPLTAKAVDLLRQAPKV